MELRINDYVRTDEGIRKIIREYDIYYELDRSLHYMYPEGHDLNKEDVDDIVLKSSPNIIDLLKKKDIVIDYKGNIYQVVKVWKDYVFTDKKNEYGQVITLVDYQIKSIVTKEQFSCMEYKIGDE